MIEGLTLVIPSGWHAQLAVGIDFASILGLQATSIWCSSSRLDMVPILRSLRLLISARLSKRPPLWYGATKRLLTRQKWWPTTPGRWNYSAESSSRTYAKNLSSTILCRPKIYQTGNKPSVGDIPFYKLCINNRFLLSLLKRLSTKGRKMNNLCIARPDCSLLWTFSTTKWIRPKTFFSARKDVKIQQLTTRDSNLTFAWRKELSFSIGWFLR